MSGECNMCGGMHAEGSHGEEAVKWYDIGFESGYNSGHANGHNEQNDRLDLWKRKCAALEAEVAKLRKKEDRWDYIRSALYRGDVEFGEAVIRMKVYGQCPRAEELDAAIDAAIRARGDA